MVLVVCFVSVLFTEEKKARKTEVRCAREGERSEAKAETDTVTNAAAMRSLLSSSAPSSLGRS